MNIAIICGSNDIVMPGLIGWKSVEKNDGFVLISLNSDSVETLQINDVFSS